MGAQHPGILSIIRVPLAMLAVFTVLLGGVYPLAIWAVAKVALPSQSSGSLIGEAGSELLGQEFSQPHYFWGRLSAGAYNAAASGGSNVSPANPLLLKAANARIIALQAADPKNTAPIPIDLITASGSGLDPHISLGAAHYQASRVARARKLAVEEVVALVESSAEQPLFGLAGVTYVNVLRLNMALDKKTGKAK